jgi:hypothetical protein
MSGSREIAHLPERVFVGLAREAANEDRAVGVAVGFGVAERVVCKEKGAQGEAGETGDGARREKGWEANAQRPAWEQMWERRTALSWGAMSVPSMLPTWIGWYLSE